jgi:hypothetical protein
MAIDTSQRSTLADSPTSTPATKLDRAFDKSKISLQKIKNKSSTRNLRKMSSEIHLPKLPTIRNEPNEDEMDNKHMKPQECRDSILTPHLLTNKPLPNLPLQPKVSKARETNPFDSLWEMSDEVEEGSKTQTASLPMGPSLSVFNIIRLEPRALNSITIEDVMEVWEIDFYNQRKFWYYFFEGVYGFYKISLLPPIFMAFKDPTFTKDYISMRSYLRNEHGLLAVAEDYYKRYENLSRYYRPIDTDKTWHQPFRKGLQRRQARAATITPLKDESRLRMFSDLYCMMAPEEIKEALGHVLTVEENDRQSKLSQEQLTELQRSTHFDKKELQQWYKGISTSFSLGGHLKLISLQGF